MKKLFNLILVATMSMTTVIGAINTGVIEPTKVYANTNSITVKVDGRTVVFDEQPMIENGSVFVPMRAIFEALGYEVKWDNEFQVAKALLEEENYLIYMNLYGGNQMILTYKEYITDYTKVGQLPYERLQSETPVEFVNRSTFSPNYTNVNGRILVPVRAISEGTGATVTWDGATKTVLIDSTNPIIKNVETNVSYDVNGAKARVNTYFSSQGGENVTDNTSTGNNDSDVKFESNKFSRGEATLEEHQAEVLRLINLEREKVGVTPLEADLKLMEIAQLKAQEMEDLDYFSHTSPNYGSLSEFVKHYGYTRAVGENIGRGSSYYVPSASVAMLMKSEGHKNNILNPSYKYLGVGRAGDFDNGLTVQIFSR